MVGFEPTTSRFQGEWSDLTDVHLVVREGRFELPISCFRSRWGRPDSPITRSALLSYTLLE